MNRERQIAKYKSRNIYRQICIAIQQSRYGIRDKFVVCSAEHVFCRTRVHLNTRYAIHENYVVCSAEQYLPGRRERAGMA